ncbi:unnamed protein product [Diatraea saccharalis]|uniref:SMP-30/Gluconolactonase/LRE-like region domain-containing protein n=1 Tax=Diatraea saccharalis TaxID=40085 RepID=A0A9N9WJG3_9NEOP|nr:unnamed protein product [Diatraea saccharalis]
MLQWLVNAKSGQLIGYGQVNVVSLVAGSKRLLVAVRSSLYLMDWDVTGTKGPQTGDDVLPDKATFYSIEQDSLEYPRIQVRPISISNGLVWSLNNTILYYIDSPTQKVEAFDYDAVKGDLSGRRTIVDISNYGYEDAIPDGMTIDSKGHLWVALMFGGTVLHIDPDSRQVIFGYKIPVSRVTSVCWGGPNLDELFVTTGRDHQDENSEPLAGAVFTIRNTGITALAELEGSPQKRSTPAAMGKMQPGLANSPHACLRLWHCCLSTESSKLLGADSGEWMTISEAHEQFSVTYEKFKHAESPVWNPHTNTLYWVDVLNQDVHALHYRTREHRVKHIEYGEVNVVLPIVNSSRVIVGVRSEVFLLDWNKEGTKGAQRGDKVESDHGVLYVLEAPHFTPEVRLKPVSISNGMVWSVNNSLLYYIDSETKRIDAFEFDLIAGGISKRRTIINLQEHGYTTAIPDGITIDKDGLLWVALMFDGSVLRVDPDSRTIVRKIELPISRATSATWAGPDLDQLVITTSRRNMAADELAKECLAGSLFFFHELFTSGLPSYQIVFPNANHY